MCVCVRARVFCFFFRLIMEFVCSETDITFSCKQLSSQFFMMQICVQINTLECFHVEINTTSAYNNTLHLMPISCAFKSTCSPFKPLFFSFFLRFCFISALDFSFLCIISSSNERIAQVSRYYRKSFAMRVHRMGEQTFFVSLITNLLSAAAAYSIWNAFQSVCGRVKLVQLNIENFG